MKKFVLAAMAAAAAASFSSSALAVDLTATAPVPDLFASELVIAGTTAVKGTKVITDLGFGVSDTQTRYIRYDFTNSTIGAGGIVAGDLVVAGPGAQVVVSSGGAAGGTNVIFQITATGNIAQTDDVTLTLTNGLVPILKQPITANYRLFETAAAAVSGSGQLASDSGTIIVFDSGVSLTAKPSTTTVSVASTPVAYSKFVPATAPAVIPTATLTQIGTVSLSTGLVPAKKPDGTNAALTDLLGLGSAITLAGTDLLAAIVAVPPATGGLTLQTGGACVAGGAGGIPGTLRTPTSVNFVLPAIAPIADGALCFEVAALNPLPIAAQVFSADVAPVPAPNALPADVAAVTAGTFIRDGLVLKTAFAETTTASGISTAIHLNNTSGAPAPFKVNCVLNVGSVAGKPGTLPALTAQRFGLSSGLGCPSNGTLRGVEIIFETTAGNVIGSTVRQNTTTGAASFDNMVGNQ